MHPQRDGGARSPSTPKKHSCKRKEPRGTGRHRSGRPRLPDQHRPTVERKITHSSGVLGAAWSSDPEPLEEDGVVAAGRHAAVAGHVPEEAIGIEVGAQALDVGTVLGQGRHPG